MCDVICTRGAEGVVDTINSHHNNNRYTDNNINTSVSPPNVHNNNNSTNNTTTPLNTNNNNKNNTTITLNDIVCDNGLYILFNNYLQRIHAQESLEFWIEVEIFKRLTSERECIKMAQSIYKKFIDDASRTEINVDSQVKEELTTKLTHHLYDTDLYDKAQECVESTLKFSCVRVFVDEILPKELRRKSQPEVLSSDRTPRTSLLQRFTSGPAPNRSIKKYRDIKLKEDKYIKSVTAGRKKKKKDFSNDSNITATNNNNTNTNSNNAADTSKDNNAHARNEKRGSGGYSSSSDTDSSGGCPLKKNTPPARGIHKLLPRRSNPAKPVSVTMMDSGDEWDKRTCMSDGEHSPRCVTMTASSPPPRLPSSPRSDPPRRKHSIGNKQRSSSMLFGFMGVNTDSHLGSKCASENALRSVSPPTVGGPLSRNLFPGYREKKEAEGEGSIKLWASQ